MHRNSFEMTCNNYVKNLLEGTDVVISYHNKKGNNFVSNIKNKKKQVKNK